MLKALRNFFTAFLILLLPIGLAAFPQALAANQYAAADAWQIKLILPNGHVKTQTLCQNYLQDDIICTLSDPYLPLTTLAKECGLDLLSLQTDAYSAVLWPADDNAWAFINEIPLAVRLYKEDGEGWQAEDLPQFEQPRMLNGELCLPLSFLDLLGINYEINAGDMQVTVYITPTTTAEQTEAMQSTAQAALYDILCAGRRLIGEYTIADDDNSLEAANRLLDIAEQLNTTIIAPQQAFAFRPLLNLDDFYNSTTQPIQIICKAGAASLTVQLWQLAAPNTATDFLGQIAP